MAGPSYYCTGVYNIDQYYNIQTNTQLVTGPCAGSIALDKSFTALPLQVITGGTGAYRGATGSAKLSGAQGSACPLGVPFCAKIDFNLD